MAGSTGEPTTAAREKLVARLRGERRVRRREHLIAPARQLTPSAAIKRQMGRPRFPMVTAETAALWMLSERHRAAVFRKSGGAQSRKQSLWTAFPCCSHSV